MIAALRKRKERKQRPVESARAEYRDLVNKLAALPENKDLSKADAERLDEVLDTLGKTEEEVESVVRLIWKRDELLEERDMDELEKRIAEARQAAQDAYTAASTHNVTYLIGEANLRIREEHEQLQAESRQLNAKRDNLHAQRSEVQSLIRNIEEALDN